VRGSIRKRGGAWEFTADAGMAAAQRCPACNNKRFWVERRPKESCPRCGGGLRETEERYRATKGGYPTRKECQAAMNLILVAVEQHSYAVETKATLKQYLTKDWLPAVKGTVRPSTYNSYVQHVACHIVPHIGSVKLQKLSGARVNALYATLAESGKADGKTDLSPQTIHHVHACLHKACKDAVKWGYITRNPLDAADPRRPRPTALAR
jgi:hypothetical protein